MIFAVSGSDKNLTTNNQIERKGDADATGIETG